MFPEIFDRAYYYIAFFAAHTRSTNISTIAIYAKNHPNLYNIYIYIRLYFIILYDLYFGDESRIPIKFFIFFFVSVFIKFFLSNTHRLLLYSSSGLENNYSVFPLNDFRNEHFTRLQSSSVKERILQDICGGYWYVYIHIYAYEKYNGFN